MDDTPSPVPASDVDEIVAAAWANDVDEKLEQINEAFVDGLPIKALTVGDATGNATASVDAAASNTATVAYKRAGTLEWSAGTETNGDYAIRRADGGGTTPALTLAADGSGGDLAGVLGSDGFVVRSGASSASVALIASAPEGVEAAEPGSLRMTTSGDLYLKLSGTGNTGWAQLSAAGTGPTLAAVLAQGSSTGANDIAVSDGQSVVPATDGQANLGSASKRFGEVHGDVVNAGTKIAAPSAELSIGASTATVQLVASGPEGSVAANPGSLAMTTSGELFVKVSGTGSTGWAQLAVTSAPLGLSDVLSQANTTGASDLVVSDGQSVRPATSAGADLGTSSLPFGNVNAQVGAFSTKVRTPSAQLWTGANEADIKLRTSAPEGSESANPGSLRVTSAGQAFVKVSGTGTTGWEKLATAADAPSSHASSHEAGGSDELEAQALGSGAATAEQVMKTDGSGGWVLTPISNGDVDGPSSATDNAIARFDGTTGKLMQNSAVSISDAGAISGVTTVNGVDVASHAARHENGGADEIDVTGLSGQLAEPQVHTASGDPSFDDDGTSGFSVGSRWISTTTKRRFTCVDATTDAARWLPVARPITPGIPTKGLVYYFDPGDANAFDGVNSEVREFTGYCAPGSISTLGSTVVSDYSGLAFGDNLTSANGGVIKFDRETGNGAVDDIFAGGGTVIVWAYPLSNGQSSHGRILSTEPSTSSTSTGWSLYNTGVSSGDAKVRFLVRSKTGGTNNYWMWNHTSSFTMTSLTYNMFGVVWDSDDIANGASTGKPTLIHNQSASTGSAVTVATTGGTTYKSDVGQPLSVGNIENASRTYDGYIGPCMVWDRALTDLELLSVYLAMKSRFGH